ECVSERFNNARSIRQPTLSSMSSFHLQRGKGLGTPSSIQRDFQKCRRGQTSGTFCNTSRGSQWRSRYAPRFHEPSSVCGSSRPPVISWLSYLPQTSAFGQV